MDQPAALGLWSYRQLQELDRRRRFAERLDRIEAAVLTHYAVCAPERLQQFERETFDGVRGTEHDAAILEEARARLNEIQLGGVLS